MADGNYWSKRMAAVEALGNQQGASYYAYIQEQFDKATAAMSSKAESWYSRLAKNNNISLADARKLLTDNELKEFHWSVEDYIKAGKENKYSQKWTKELENASARVHISRLEAMQLQMQQECEKLYGNMNDGLDSTLASIYREGYYHTAFELQKGVGVGAAFNKLDTDRIEKTLRACWANDEKNFSDRIWSNKTKLVNELKTVLVQNIIRGESADKAINALAGRMGVSKSAAGNVIMTESAAISSQAQRDCFDDLDVEQFEVVATLDEITCGICAPLNGLHFKMSEFQIGATAPPFHPRCRCCTAPYFNDEFTQGDQRAARDADGESYRVPADMTYGEWKKSFVGGDKSGLQPVKEDDTIKAKKEVEQVVEELQPENFPAAFTTKGEMKNTKELADYVNGLEGADAKVVALYNRMGALENIESNGIDFKISHGKGCAVQTSSYRGSGELADVKLTIPKLSGDNLAGQVNTTLHEEMHLMDLYGRKDPKKSGDWFSTSRQSLVDAFKKTDDTMSDDIVELFNAHKKEYSAVRSATSDKYQQMITELNNSMLDKSFEGTYAEYEKQYKNLVSLRKSAIDYECRNVMGGGIGNLEDIYDALSGGKFRDNHTVTYGHGSAYYSDVISRVHETIANYAALSVTRPDLIALLKADKPDLVAELDATIKELLKKVGGD